MSGVPGPRGPKVPNLNIHMQYIIKVCFEWEDVAFKGLTLFYDIYVLYVHYSLLMFEIVFDVGEIRTSWSTGPTRSDQGISYW